MLTSKTAKTQEYTGSVEAVWSWLKWHPAKSIRHYLLYVVAVCGVAIWISAVCPKIGAQTAHYTGWGGVVQSGTTLSSPFGVTLDSAEQYAYVGDTSNHRILRVKIADGTWTTPYLYNSSSDPGCQSPQYPSFDSSLNVYFGCRDTTAFYKATYNSGTGTWGAVQALFTTPGGTGSYGTHIDSSNNLWIAEIDGNNNQEPYILKCTTSGSCVTYYTFPSPSSLGVSNTFVPQALAEDSSGNFYISDPANAVVWKLSNAGTTSAPVAGTLSQFASNISCYGITLDSSGNVYLATNTSNVIKETYSSGSYTASTITTIPGLLYRSVGLAVNAAGTTIYAADYTDSNQNLGNNLYGPTPGSSNLIRFGTTPQTLGSVAVGSTSAALTLNFSFDTGGTLGSISVVTQGIASLDFASASTGTCTAGTTYSTSATCTVNVTFTPTKVGLRYGAVVLKNSSGTPFATGYVYGTGTGAVLDFSPVSQTTLDSSAAGAEGIVGDAAGNLYIAAGSAVYKEAYSAGTYTRSTLFTSALGTNFSSLQALAIDGAGNLYLGDGGNGRIIKETLAGGTYTPQVICTTNSSNGIYCGANEVAVDVAGDVFYLSGNTSAVNKLTFEPTPQASNNNTYYSLPVNIATNNNNPWGVAVDASGNVYYTTANTSNPTCVLYKLTPAGASYVQTALDSTLSDPTSISLDGLGNIYIAQDPGTSGSVVKETYVSGTTYTRSTLISPIANPVGVWADTSGNVFATSQGSGTLVELAYAGPPSLSFSSTNVGSTSASQTVTIQNVGNAALTFPIPSSGNTNPSVSANFGWTTTGGSACPALTSSSGSAGTLAAGSTCTYPIYFAPVSGTSDTGTFVLTDNSASGTTQTINLSGTASYPSAPTVTGVSPSNGTLLGGVTVTITGTNLLGATAVSFGGTAATIISVSSTQVVVTSPAVSSPGTIDVRVTTPNSTSAISSSDDYVNTKATKTITFAQPTTPALQGVVATLSATASNGDAVTFSIVGGTGSAMLNGSQITYTGAGTVIIEADSSSTSTYFAAAAVQQTVTVNALTLSSLAASSASNTTTSPAIVGEPVQITVAAIDSQNQTQDAYFTGTVTLSCGGCSATLPGAYTYQLSDAGSHAFSVTFNARGTYTITATSGSVSTNMQVKAGDAVWVLNAAGTLSKLNGGGTGVTTGIGTSGTAAGYGGAAFDSFGNAWSVSNSSNTLYFATYMGTGATSYTGGGLNAPSSVAVDGLGYVWVANKTGNTVSEFTNAGVAQSSSSGYGSSYSSGDTLNAPSSIAIDQTGGVWVANKTGNTVTHIFGAAAPVVTPLATATANGTQGTRP